jgi:hypothetical protein
MIASDSKLVYLSGKITGLPRWYVKLKFGLSEMSLRVSGFDVWNPVSNVPANASWGNAMQICLDALNRCELVYFHKDWKDSRGARIEFRQAAKMGKVIINNNRRISEEYYDMVAESINLKESLTCVD